MMVNWTNSTCDCPYALKNYMCKHIIGISIRFKYVKVPPKAKYVSIEPKIGPGRPPKAKPRQALLRK